MRILTSLALVLCLQVLVAQSVPFLQQLFRADCDGTFELAASTPFGLGARVPVLRNIFNTALDVLWGRVSCACPSVTKDEFNLHFNPVDAGLNGLQSLKTPAVTCINTNFPRNLFELEVFKIALPSSCDYTSWKTSGTCGLSYTFDRLDATLEFGLSKCADAYAPAVSLTCSGNGCQNLLKPCNSDADCGNLHCFDADAYIGFPDYPSILFQGLALINVYDNHTESSPGCYQAKRGAGAKTTSNDIFTNLFSYFASEAFDLTQSFSKLKVCGVLDAANFTATNFSIEDTAVGDATIDTSLVTVGQSSCLANLTQSAGSIFDGMSATSRVQVTIPGLNSWNGVDSSGNNVFQTTRFLPTAAPISSDNLLLVSLTCDQNLVFPNHNAGLVLSKKFSDLLHHAVGLLQDLAACRTNPATTDYKVFLARFGMWNPEFWLNMFDSSSASFTLPVGVDFRTMFGNNHITLHNLPQSCNFQRWLTSGVCEIDFKGLNSLLLADMTLRLTAKTCAANNLFASFSLECIGADCPLFYGLNPCDTTSQCTKSMQCQDVGAFLNTVGAVNTTDFNKGLNTDFIDLVFGSAQNTNLCSAPAWAKDSTTFDAVLGHSQETTCAGPTAWQRDVQKMVLGVAGSSHMNQNVQSKLKFCMLPSSLVDGDAFQAWAQGLLTVSGTDITLNTAAFVNVVTPVNPTTANPDGQSGVAFLTPSVFVLLFAIVLALLL